MSADKRTACQIADDHHLMLYNVTGALAALEVLLRHIPALDRAEPMVGAVWTVLDCAQVHAARAEGHAHHLSYSNWIREMAPQTPQTDPTGGHEQ